MEENENMKRYIGATLALLVVCTLIVGLAVQSAPAQAQAKKLKIGLVTDVGGVDDRSFNQSAWEGAQAGAKAVSGEEPKYIISQKDTDYSANIKLFADQNYDVIITVGFGLAEATNKAAADYKNIKFIGVDQFQTPGKEIPNVTGLIFKEDQAGFLVGVLAGRMTKSGTVAAVLGTDQVPPVVAFGEGFKSGVLFVNPKAKVLKTYHPGGLAGFNDSAWGAQTAGQAIDQGADVIFGAGGKLGNGALEEVAGRTTKDKPLLCIGVDTDQWLTLTAAHPCLVTSAMKLITPGVEKLIKQVADGTIKPGNYFGEVGAAPFHDFDTTIPDALKKELDSIKQELLDNKLNTDGTRPTPGATMAATKAATAAK